jgi:hypothetical protein
MTCLRGGQPKKVHSALYFCQLAPINEGHRLAHGLCHGWWRRCKRLAPKMYFRPSQPPQTTNQRLTPGVGACLRHALNLGWLVGALSSPAQSPAPSPAAPSRFDQWVQYPPKPVNPAMPSPLDSSDKKINWVRFAAPTPPTEPAQAAPETPPSAATTATPAAVPPPTAISTTTAPASTTAAAYQAWLGFYNGRLRKLCWSKGDLVREANDLILR